MKTGYGQQLLPSIYMETNQKTPFSHHIDGLEGYEKQYREYCTEDKLFESASTPHMREVEVVAQSEKAQAQSPLSPVSLRRTLQMDSSSSDEPRTDYRNSFCRELNYVL